MQTTNQSNDEYMHVCGDRIMVSFMQLYTIIKNEYPNQKDDLNEVVLKRLAQLDFYVTYDGFYYRIDNEFLPINYNHIKCIAKNDTGFNAKLIERYFNALLNHAKISCKIKN